MLTAVAVGALLVTAGLLAPGAEAATGLVWTACTDEGLIEAGAQCTRLTVPVDHARPSGAKLTLALSRVRHTSPDSAYQGVMLVNPGGPGAPGLGLATLGASVPGEVGGRYDWIGFDPRGVGASSPALTCDPAVNGYHRPYYVPLTRTIEKAWLDRSRDYAAKCGRAGGALLDHLRGTDIVQDIDHIRRALAAPKINFYGFSYGSYLGQLYATRFPGNVRRMVLDGVADPGRLGYRGQNLDQDPGFDRNMGLFFDWIAKHDDIYHLGTSGAAVERTYYAEEARLRRAPAGGVIGPDELSDALLDAGYGVLGWADDAAAFAALINDDDPGPVKDLYDSAYPQEPGGDNGTAGYLATVCTDSKWPRDYATWKRDATRLHRVAPYETWANVWFNAPCLFWPARAADPARIDGGQAPPVLLLSETFDAATPFSGALEARRRFPRSVLIEGVGGSTHAASLNGVACTDDAVAAYLRDGSLPRRLNGSRSDKRCEPLPQPDPSATTAADPAAAKLGRRR
ncbi:peptidase [Paractinoplanes toevensis]|uniref:Peptidase n=1 Tax=Paractinoplanes toevensis TaxID=571911 RepID=A0A919T4L0_9ACTN|nr:peptidase [Actinoplanes toevensis]